MIINDSIKIDEKSKYPHPIKLNPDEKWVTSNGTHIVVDKDGNQKVGPKINKDDDKKKSSDKKSNKSEPIKTGPDEWATNLANAIENGADWIGNNVIRNFSHH